MLLSSRLRSLTIVLGAAAVLAGCGDDDTTESSDAAETVVECAVVADGESPIDGVVVEDCGSSQHVRNPVYTSDPPSGGQHLAPPEWLNCGVYDDPVPNGSAVHSLEHGAIWYAHQPDLPDAEIDMLVDLAAANSDRIIVSPYPDLPAAVVAVAWERRLEVDAADDPRLVEFFEEYVNGNQAPEPAAACQGGVGEPG